MDGVRVVVGWVGRGGVVSLELCVYWEGGGGLVKEYIGKQTKMGTRRILSKNVRACTVRIGVRGRSRDKRVKDVSRVSVKISARVSVRVGVTSETGVYGQSESG